MIDEVQALLDRYVAWLRDKTTLRQVGPWVEITTPYLDRYNDYLQIYAKRDDGGFLLTDDGYVVQDLRQSGCNLDSPHRKQLLTMTLNGFGVQLNEAALEIRATGDNFALRKHSLVQAMLAVDDLFYTAEPVVRSLFYEDVLAWLEEQEIRYTRDVVFTGRTGYPHRFPFVIPKSRTQPERILQQVSRPSRETAQAAAFGWVDTREARPESSRAYVLLNDSQRAVSVDVGNALRSYEMVPVLWSLRDGMRAQLVA